MSETWNIIPGAPLLAAGIANGDIKVQRLPKTLDQLTLEECIAIVSHHHGHHHDRLIGWTYDTARRRLQELWDDHIIDQSYLPKRGTLPTKAYEGDAGWDIYSDVDINIHPWSYGRIPTGIAIELPPGYCAVIRDRSSMGGKGIHHFGGVLDYGYRNEVHVVLSNFNSVEYNIRCGDRVAQALIVPVPHFRIVEVDQLSHTQRGTRGFGSSGS